jgi:tRNA(Ile)-lysidine synthase
MALLHMLMRRKCEGLIVAHLDHKLRTESGAEAHFVEQFAQRHRLEVVIGSDNVRARAKRRKQSIETAARAARYEFFARVAGERSCPRLVLAHHADDLNETFLCTLGRGRGSAGRAGMQPTVERVVAGVELKILRPLLGMWRAQIDEYVARHAVEFLEDASNMDLRHTRNRLRHELLPALERIFGRDVRGAIRRAAEILAAENELLEAQTPSAGSELAVVTIGKLPLALQRRVLRAWLKAGDVPNIGFDEIERVRAMIDGRTAKTNLAGGKHARRRAMKLFIEG